MKQYFTKDMVMDICSYGLSSASAMHAFYMHCWHGTDLVSFISICLFCGSLRKVSLFDLYESNPRWRKKRQKGQLYSIINVGKYRRGYHKWTIQRNLQHRMHKTKKNKTKTQHNMCWTPLCASKHK